MEEIIMPHSSYATEIVEIIRKHLSDKELPALLSDYHENDIAEAFEHLTPEERKAIYPILGAEYVAEIFSYIEDAHEYLKELQIEKAAKVIASMDLSLIHI